MTARRDPQAPASQPGPRGLRPAQLALAAYGALLLLCLVWVLAQRARLGTVSAELLQARSRRVADSEATDRLRAEQLARGGVEAALAWLQAERAAGARLAPPWSRGAPLGQTYSGGEDHFRAELMAVEGEVCRLRVVGEVTVDGIDGPRVLATRTLEVRARVSPARVEVLSLE